MKELILTAFILTLACESPRQDRGQQTDERTKGNDSKLETAKSAVSVDTIPKRPTTTNRYTLADVQGAWGESLDENAYFLIDGDSVIYIEGEVMRIRLLNDSLIFYYPDRPRSFKINWIKGDTMSLMLHGEADTLIRVAK